MPAHPQADAFELHARFDRPLAASHLPEPGDPGCRRLQIFTSDPTASRLAGRSTVAQLHYEPLTLKTVDAKPRYDCLCGQLFELHMVDADGRALAPPRLDDAVQLMRDGYPPSESDPRFHAQMVYAVASCVHADFRRALGREPGWGFAGTYPQLKVFPLGTSEENAWYAPDTGELVFGVFPRPDSGWYSTALMHDIVAHELTHALLDSQRPHFMEPTGPDVAGFHEGFADLVALFQHFQHREPLRAALAESGGVIVARKAGERPADWLCCIAKQFGAADGLSALRRADRPAGKEAGALIYDDKLEAHDMGELLLSAVFDAFDTVYRRRTERMRRLATGGSGLLPPGAMHPDLLDALTDAAASLARRFMSMIVRALDYCPPANISLGEYLRAMVSADTLLVPDDRWCFREALIDAFRVRHILPRHVFSLTEDSLRWGPPAYQPPPATALSFAATLFDGGPGRPLQPENRRSQARALGQWLMAPRTLAECGLVAPGDPALKALGASVTRPCIDALEVTSYASPSGDMHFHTVAVVTQRCTVAARSKKPGFSFQAGGTLLFDPAGEMRLAISKSALGGERIQRRRDFLVEAAAVAQSRAAGAAPPLWVESGGMLQPAPGWLRNYHQQQRRRKA